MILINENIKNGLNKEKNYLNKYWLKGNRQQLAAKKSEKKRRNETDK